MVDSMSDAERTPGPPFLPADILTYAAAKFGDKVALRNAGRQFSFRELERLSAAVAAALQRRGIGDGDVVSIYGQNSWQWLVSYHGTLRAGAVVNPLNVMLSGPELTYALNDCRARVLFAGAEQMSLATTVTKSLWDLQLVVAMTGPDTPEAVGFDDLTGEADTTDDDGSWMDPASLCAMAYTSGTTGYPKAAMQSHQSIVLNCALTASMHGRHHTDTVVTALPAAHVYGNIAINSTFLTGGTVVLMERFNAAQALQLIASEQATIFEGVPTMYAKMLADPTRDSVDLRSLRLCTVGGQSVTEHVAREWQSYAGVGLLELWGMTELSGLGTTHSVHAPPVPGSIGVPLPGMELKVIARRPGEPDREAAVGEQGELAARGPLVMMGYYGNPTGTAEALDNQGWLKTGDVAYRDDAGYYYIVDRVKDVILTGGYNVYPAEIERVVGEHPDVAMVAVGKHAEEVRGEIAVAYVIVRPGSVLTERDILEFCAPRLAAYKRPRAVVFVDHLPMTSSGKLLRRQLNTLDTPADIGIGPIGATEEAVT
jgi:long-chain acyl-CoA synthetase